MKITHCQVNHLNDPLGFSYGKAPVFHWVVEDAAGTKQTAARIVVEKVDRCTGQREAAADTGWKAQDSLAAPVAVALAPRTRYVWTVAVRTDGEVNGAPEEAVSGEHFFETGKMDESWTGKWIAAENTEEPRHPIFSKEIRTAAGRTVAGARLYISAAGLYEAAFDGNKIGNEYLTPYCTNYHAWFEVITHDVTDQIKGIAGGGSGVLSVMLGNGWYNGRFGFTPDPVPHFKGGTKLIAELHIAYTDGTEEVIGTDESWEVTRSNLIFSNIYDGEQRDDTLPAVPAEKAVLAEAPEGALKDRLSLPVVVKHELPVKELIHTPAGETVLDLGQNQAGIFRLHLHVPAGTRVHLQVGEVLQQGNFYRDNLRTAKAEYIYISDGRELDLVPHFTFYGYRYVKVEGVPDLKAEDFTALTLYSDMDQTGGMTTGQAKINRLLLNAEWGKRSNFLDVPTDCPQRDERMGWTGDAEVFSPTALFQSDAYAFYRKYLYDMATEQASHDGMTPDVVPAFDVYSCACAWGDATTIIPWNMYQYTGDDSILRQHYDAMKAWVDYCDRLDAKDWGWRNHFHYGDWLALDGGGAVDECLGGTDEGFLAEVYKLYSTEIVRDTAALLGRTEDAAEYGRRCETDLEEIRKEYYSPTGRSCIDTQTAYLLALKFGLSTDPERMKERLIRKLNKNDRNLQTGFIGTPLLAEGLTECGRSDMAYHLLFHEGFPGWLYEVNLGATTIWERWNSMLPDGSVSSTGMNSFNHYSYGAIATWLYERVAGLRRDPAVPGFRRVLFAPLVNWKLGHAEAEYQSAAGFWKSAWEVKDDHTLEVHLTVPFGCEAQVTLPHFDPASLKDGAENAACRTNPLLQRQSGSDFLAGPGEYCITYRTDVLLRKVYSTRMPIRELLETPEVKKVLMELIPQITQLPEQYRGMDIRTMVGLRGTVTPEMEKRFDEIDAALRKVEV